MPKIHNIGPKHFVQFIDLPVKWGWKLAVKGWTQEIEPPYRHATPLLVRMPFHKAFVVGKWNGEIDNEEEALSRAIEGRILKDEDFHEGWTPAAYEAPEESGWDSDSRPGDLGGELLIRYWQGSYGLDEDEGPVSSGGSQRGS
jgi:hypothetical protein